MDAARKIGYWKKGGWVLGVEVEGGGGGVLGGVEVGGEEGEF